MRKRYVEEIIILPLHGLKNTLDNITEAIAFLGNYDEDGSEFPLSKYEITIKYNNGDKIEGSFKDKKDSLKFLKTYS